MKNHNTPDLKGYELVERIGAGGFGAVYRARQTTIGREVAVKVIQPGLANKPDFIRRFEAEAQLIARLEHPHITPLIDYWRDSEGAYLVMRYLRGGSLHDALKDGALELNTISTVLDQLASALDFSHRQQVIHRDLKPGNLLLDEDGNAYLADFGIAKDLTIQESNTSPNAVVGSLDYISPEQARSEPVTPRTDIYSLGVVLYELIAGEHPFKTSSTIERLYKHLNEPLPKIENLPDDLRDKINEIIQQATEKDPAKRYSDVLALALAFREAIGRGSTTADLQVVEQLTMREHEILQLLAEGLSNREIAEKLFIEISTVRWYLRAMYKKMGIRGRVQAIVRAREMNLITTERVADLIEADEQLRSLNGISLPEPENPYKGLHAFQTADARDFFGREDLSEKLLKKLQETDSFKRFLAVVGPSGSGKSSLVRAGVIPRIWQGKIHNSEKWFVVDMIPGSRPLDELEIALTRVAANQSPHLHEHLSRDQFGLVRAAELLLPKDDTQLVLVIDQFEEIFTLVPNEEARQHFLNLIHAAVTDKRSRIYVIVTLRADYYDRPLHYPQFGEMLRQRMETVLPLSAKGLERAIAGPAERVGVTFEAGLVAQIVSEMNYQSGALPLLQYALTELFDHREGRLLTHEAYNDIGGAVGALANKADEIFLGLSEEAQELARQIFLRLVTLGEGAEDTRRRTGFIELLSLSDKPDMVEEIIDSFADYRLLSLDHDEETRQPTVEVAHEAILREWERLRQWLNDSRDDIRQERQLAQAAEDWKANNQDKSYLLRGSRLEQVENWGNRTELILTPLETEYIESSIRQREIEVQEEAERKEHETQLEQQAINRLRIAAGIFAIATIVGFILAAIAFNASNVATTERDNARLAADESLSVAVANSAKIAFDNDEHDLALALAIKANELVDKPLPQVRRTLVDIAYAPGLRAIWRDAGLRNMAFDMRPDGRYIVTGEGGRQIDVDGIVPELAIWDVQTGEKVRLLGTDAIHHEASILTARFTPDGQHVLTSDSTNHIYLWDVETGEMLREYPLPETGYSYALVVSPDGQTMLTSSCLKGHPATGCESGYAVVLWDFNTDEILNTYQFSTAIDTPLVYSQDGQSFFSYEFIRAEDAENNQGYISRRDINTGEAIFRNEYDRDIISLALSPDGSELLIGDVGNQIQVIDAETGEYKRTFESEFIDTLINSMSFSPDGRMLLSGSSAGLIQLWDVASGTEIERFRASTRISHVAFTPDAQSAIVNERNGELMLWDIVQSNHRRAYPLKDVAGIWGSSFKALSDGERVLIGTGTPFTSEDFEKQEDLILFNLVTGEEIWRVPAQKGVIGAIAVSPDETMALTVSRNSTEPIRLWDIATGELLHEFVTASMPNFLRGPAAFTADSQKVLISTNGMIQLFDIETGAELRRFIHGGFLGRIDLSEDERLLLTSEWYYNNSVRVWDFETGELLQTFRGHNQGVTQVAFLPGDTQALSGSFDGTIRIWDVATAQEIAQFEGVSGVGQTWGELNKEGNRVLFTTPENNIVLLDLEIGAEVAQFGGQGEGTSAIFSADGTQVIIAGWDGAINVWDIPPQSSAEVIDWVHENRVTRELTNDECGKYRLPCYVPEDKPVSEPITLSGLPTATPIYDTSDVKVAEIGENRGWIQAGETVYAQNLAVPETGSYDVWVYHGQAGEVLTIEAIADNPSRRGIGINSQLQDGLMNARLELYDPNGQYLAQNNDISQDDLNARIENFELPTDGDYRIEVAGYMYYTGGDYTLTIKSDRAE